MRGHLFARIPSRYGALIVAALFYSLAIAIPTQATATPELTDQAVGDAVEDELRADYLVPENELDIVAVDGVVTLTGVVSTLLSKERATQIAESVKGVRAVINRIEVRPYLSRTMEQIEMGVDRALRMNPATEAYGVEVDLQSTGTAVLTGRVDSWAEKDLAGQVAKNVAGVTGLRNEIVVDYKESRRDNELKQEVEQRLLWNVLVDAALIDTRVENGDVYLSGTVGSAAEKREARTSAWVASVGFVDVSGLEVARWARDEDLRHSRNIYLKAEDVEAAVVDAVYYDPRVATNDLAVEVVSGVATLRGTVRSLQAKRAAAQDARNTVGVEAVDNRLKVRPDVADGDPAIAENVREALRRDAVVESWEIDLTVKNGVVTLWGSVENAFEKSHADKIAANVKGVKEVRNRIAVSEPGSPYFYDPYFDYWPPNSSHPYAYEPGYSWTPDTEIRQRILDQLWWSPFVDAGEVTVSVDNGVATLTGAVGTWAERRAARKNAFDGGAVWVINRLEVEPGRS